MKFTLAIATLAACLLQTNITHAATVYTNTDRIRADISDDNGQLIDWSNTDRKIEAIFIDNPERFRESFIFVADGCNKNKCVNATAISISARTTSRNSRATMKVRLIDSKGRRSIVVISVEKVPYNGDGTIVFAAPPEQIPSKMFVTSPLFSGNRR
jgi:hypothetical protein